MYGSQHGDLFGISIRAAASTADDEQVSSPRRPASDGGRLSRGPGGSRCWSRTDGGRGGGNRTSAAASRGRVPIACSRGRCVWGKAVAIPAAKTRGAYQTCQKEVDTRHLWPTRLQQRQLPRMRQTHQRVAPARLPLERHQLVVDQDQPLQGAPCWRGEQRGPHLPAAEDERQAPQRGGLRRRHGHQQGRCCPRSEVLVREGEVSKTGRHQHGGSVVMQLNRPRALLAPNVKALPRRAPVAGPGRVNLQVVVQFYKHHARHAVARVSGQSVARAKLRASAGVSNSSDDQRLPPSDAPLVWTGIRGGRKRLGSGHSVMWSLAGRRGAARSTSA